MPVLSWWTDTKPKTSLRCELTSIRMDYEQPCTDCTPTGSRRGTEIEDQFVGDALPVSWAEEGGTRPQTCQ